MQVTHLFAYTNFTFNGSTPIQTITPPFIVIVLTCSLVMPIPVILYVLPGIKSTLLFKVNSQ